MIKVSDKNGSFEEADVERVRNIANSVKLKLNHFADVEQLLNQHELKSKAMKASLGKKSNLLKDLSLQINADARNVADRSVAAGRTEDLKWMLAVVALLQEHSKLSFIQTAEKIVSVLKGLVPPGRMQDLNVYVINPKAGRFVDICSSNHEEQALNVSSELAAVCSDANESREGVFTVPCARTGHVSIFIRCLLLDSTSAIILRLLLRRCPTLPLDVRRIKLVAPCVDFLLSSSLDTRKDRKKSDASRQGLKLLRLAGTLAKLDEQDEKFEASLCSLVEKEIPRAFSGAINARLYLKTSANSTRCYSYNRDVMICADEEEDLAALAQRGVTEVFDSHSREKRKGLYFPVGSLGFLQVLLVNIDGAWLRGGNAKYLKEICTLILHSLEKRNKAGHQSGMERSEASRGSASRLGFASACDAHEVNAKLRLENLFLRAEIRQLKAKRSGRHPKLSLDVVDRLVDSGDSASEA